MKPKVRFFQNQDTGDITIVGQWYDFEDAEDGTPIYTKDDVWVSLGAIKREEADHEDDLHRFGIEEIDADLTVEDMAGLGTEMFLTATPPNPTDTH